MITGVCVICTQKRHLRHNKQLDKDICGYCYRLELYQRNPQSLVVRNKCQKDYENSKNYKSMRNEYLKINKDSRNERSKLRCLVWRTLNFLKDRDRQVEWENNNPEKVKARKMKYYYLHREQILIDKRFNYFLNKCVG